MPAPKPIHDTYTFPPNVLSETDQNFDFQVDVNGKTKTIDLPDGGQIITAPGQDATTNLTSTSQTLNITGTTHISTLEDGSTLYEVDGRNLLFDPSIGPNVPLASSSLSAISATFSDLKPTPTPASPLLTQPLDGQGQVVNVFDLLV